MPEEGRTQPEFSTGERLRGIESEVAALNRRFEEAKELSDEKLLGLRREVEAKNSAQKESVSKSEISTDRRLELIGVQMANDREAIAKRVAALERGEAGSRGIREWVGRWALVASSFAAIGVLIFYIIHA